MNDLQARLLSAHEDDDRSALIALYIEAADQAASVEACYFYLTHAYVFALELGDPRAADLRDRLRAAGREA